MRDQADSLRQNSAGTGLAPSANKSGTIRGIAVASGKGGVGKTNTVANLAYILARQGKRTLVFDADMGLGNMHILMGLAPRYNIQHVMDGLKSMEDIILPGPGGFDVLPAGSGHRHYSELNGEEMLALKTELESLESKYDYILFDIGAGISANVMYFCSAASEIVVVTSTEPTSFADAYALIKVLARDYDKHEFRLIVNSAKTRQEANLVHSRLEMVADRFGLNTRIDMLGWVAMDDSVSKAVRSQKLFAQQYPNSRASVCIKDIADNILTSSAQASIDWEHVFSA